VLNIGGENIMEERRAFKRADVELKVIYSGNSMHNEKGRVSNIGRGGMFVRTDEPLEKGSHIFASMDVDTLGQIVWAQGRVVRVTEDGMGIKFTDSDYKGIETIVGEKSVHRHAV
jgi:c-di-GMP-binding flagellar brake protein YcgR